MLQLSRSLRCGSLHISAAALRSKTNATPRFDPAKLAATNATKDLNNNVTVANAQDQSNFKDQSRLPMDRDYSVYLLKNTSNKRTYLGITNNTTRRLRQHNGELKGGARYTKAFKGDGEWEYYFKVLNLTKSEALSIERTAKNTRKGSKGKNPMQQRLNVLLPILKKYPESNRKYFYIKPNN